MAFSFRERFIGLPNPHSNGLYAPLTLGCPAFTNYVDYKVFKKNLEERVRTAEIKAAHKRDLIRAYGKGNTKGKMNVSSA